MAPSLFVSPSSIPEDVANQSQWDQCVATSRHGIVTENDPSWVYGVENFAGTNSALQNPAWSDGATGSIGELVYRLFTPNYFQSWETFASTKFYHEHPGTDYLSLEYVHNNIHVSHCQAPQISTSHFWPTSAGKDC
jgi:tyrosinase